MKTFLRQGDGGNIINLVSTAGLPGHPRQSVYNTSKGAQANLTRCLAIEYGHEGIRVNGICPTYAKTALTRELFDDKDFDHVFTESIPLKRWGETEDLAHLAVFLASDEFSYLHGDLVRIDGGETLCRYSVELLSPVTARTRSTGGRLPRSTASSSLADRPVRHQPASGPARRADLLATHSVRLPSFVPELTRHDRPIAARLPCRRRGCEPTAPALAERQSPERKLATASRAA